MKIIRLDWTPRELSSGRYEEMGDGRVLVTSPRKIWSSTPQLYELPSPMGRRGGRLISKKFKSGGNLSRHPREAIDLARDRDACHRPPDMMSVVVWW